MRKRRPPRLRDSESQRVWVELWMDMPMPPVNAWTLLSKLSLCGATIGSVVAGIVFGTVAGWSVALVFVILWIVVTERRP